MSDESLDTREGMANPSVCLADRLSVLSNKSKRILSVVSRATYDAMRFAVMFPKSATTAQASITAHHRKIRATFFSGATSSII